VRWVLGIGWGIVLGIVLERYFDIRPFSLRYFGILVICFIDRVLFAAWKAMGR
jgi:hypothetical protein